MNHLRPVTNLIFSILVALLSVLTVLPLVFTGIISISSEASIAAKGYSFFPQQLTLDAYRYLIRSIDTIGRSLLVSVVVTALGTLISLWLISTMAYVLSRDDFIFRRFYTILILIPMFFGGGLVASYVVNTQLFALKNSIWALILPQACSGWYIIVMRTYFRNNIPAELIDAARMDGAGTVRIFNSIVIPLSKPIFAAIGLFEAFAYWNSWYNAMLYLRPEHQELYPLQYL
ncbi:MAG: carbohydrate ABC transporter permease, partial [Lachnospiraceae bacterium]|nr:carbohydrate ABC transporter permease [Lachnospiraceae bacterium]